MRRTALLLLWLITDVLVFTGAYIVAYFLRVGWIFSNDFPFDRYVQTVLLAAPLAIAVLAQLGVFRLLRVQMNMRNIAHIVFGCVMGISFFTLGYYFLFIDFFSRLLLVYAFGLSSALLIVWHIVFERIMRSVLRSGKPLYPTLIVGATREAERLIKTLNQKKSPLMPVAVLDGRGTKETHLEGVPVEGKLNKLEETILRHRITHLIQCSDAEQALNLLSACRNHGMTYMILPSVFGVVEGDEQIESIEGHQATVVRGPQPVWSWFFR